MKKPVVDYRQFRFSKLKTKEFSHLLWLLGWVWYLSMYVLTERLIPLEKCHLIHSKLDDLIPFNEYFAFFYISWYVMVVGWLLYYLLYDVERFKRVQIYIILTQVIAMIIYIVYPSYQDMRPVSFEHNNLFTFAMSIIYGVDTPTGICPSLHVGYSIAIFSACVRDKNIKPFIKGLTLFFVIMISAAVCFVKQHSIVDVFAAVIMCAFIELIMMWLDKKYFKYEKQE